ncbi:bcl-2-binding component 3, isoforms 3/4-like [Sceloporus undulatus]|uniref:bcl-2-binding component 3, isoforms 3/4-like n=1 Tax=Sceloporus undulatus TaxID=8520 RepID=UPI001C4AE7A2|nr:bcl-2-binding component 3, isoforms 3/4-like [Sceloporus undulatus]
MATEGQVLGVRLQPGPKGSRGGAEAVPMERPGPTIYPQVWSDRPQNAQLPGGGRGPRGGGHAGIVAEWQNVCLPGRLGLLRSPATAPGAQAKRPRTSGSLGGACSLFSRQLPPEVDTKASGPRPPLLTRRRRRRGSAAGWEGLALGGAKEQQQKEGRKALSAAAPAVGAAQSQRISPQQSTARLSSLGSRPKGQPEGGAPATGAKAESPAGRLEPSAGKLRGLTPSPAASQQPEAEVPGCSACQGSRSPAPLEKGRRRLPPPPSPLGLAGSGAESRM